MPATTLTPFSVRTTANNNVNPMIRFSNVTKQYSNGQFGIQNLSMEIPPNRLVFIAGPTGAGKSTTARLIALRDRPSEGQVFVGDTDLADVSGKYIAQYRSSIGILFPDLPLLNDRSVGDNVALPLTVQSTPAAKIFPRVKNTLDMVGLRSKLNFRPKDLTDAERQRVRIARTIITRPALIIADEPTADMDAILGAKVMTIFQRLASRNTTVVIATHKRAHLADRRHLVIELRNGQLANAKPKSSKQNGN